MWHALHTAKLQQGQVKTVPLQGQVKTVSLQSSIASVQLGADAGADVAIDGLMETSSSMAATREPKLDCSWYATVTSLMPVTSAIDTMACLKKPSTSSLLCHVWVEGKAVSWTARHAARLSANVNIPFETLTAGLHLSSFKTNTMSSSSGACPLLLVSCCSSASVAGVLSANLLVSKCNN